MRRLKSQGIARRAYSSGIGRVKQTRPLLPPVLGGITRQRTRYPRGARAPPDRRKGHARTAVRRPLSGPACVGRRGWWRGAVARPALRSRQGSRGAEDRRTFGCGVERPPKVDGARGLAQDDDAVTRRSGLSKSRDRERDAHRDPEPAVKDLHRFECQLPDRLLNNRAMPPTELPQRDRWVVA